MHNIILLNFVKHERFFVIVNSHIIGSCVKFLSE